MICTCQNKIKNKLPGKRFQESIAYLAGFPKGICQHEFAIKTFDICPLKYYSAKENI